MKQETPKTPENAAVFIFSGDYKKQRLVLNSARTENLRHGSVFHDVYLDVMEILAKIAEDDRINDSQGRWFSRTFLDTSAWMG